MTPPTPAEIRAWRIDRSWTQARAAEAVGVTERTWRRWESGEDTPLAMLWYAMTWIGLHGPLEG